MADIDHQVPVPVQLARYCELANAVAPPSATAALTRTGTRPAFAELWITVARLHLPRVLSLVDQ